MFSILSTRKLLVMFIILACFSITTGIEITIAQEKYPARDIEVIVPFAAGGVLDLTTRIFAEELSKVLKVTIVPTNKPGATGTIGTIFVLKAKKDGYTLLANSISGMVIAHFVLPDVPFVTLKDFIPVTTIAVAPNTIVVKNDSPFKSFEDLIDFAKKNPGKLTYGSAGTGSDVHLVMEQLQDAAKIKLSHVPFKGGGEVLPAVLGGHVDFGSMTLTTAASNLKAGTIRGLVSGSEKRVSIFPNLPTYREKGYPQHFIGFWNGLFAPAGTPKSAIDVLSSASEKVLKSKAFMSRVEDLGASAEYKNPAEFRKFIEEEEKILGTIVKQVGIKPSK